MSITLTHEIKEVEIILAALRKLPMEIAEELVAKVRAQAIPQVQAAQAAEQTASTEATTVEATPVAN